jgi:predicted amidohydrolase YtcJ
MEQEPTTSDRSASGGGPRDGHALLLRNIRGWTVAGGSLRRFSSLLIDSSGRVSELDGPTAARVGSSVEVVDGGGRYVLPGLTDAHGHLMHYASSRETVDLSGVSSTPALKKELARFAATHPGSGWILGGGWRSGVSFEFDRLPAASDLDQVVKDRPVWLTTADGHAGVANSAALARAGITGDLRDSPGGMVLRDAAGHPTGVLIDRAMSPLLKSLPARGTEDRRRMALEAQAALNRMGLTSVGDAHTSADDIKLFRYLARERALTLRLNLFLDADAFLTRERTSPEEGHDEDDWLRVATVKLFSDGAMGSWGAAMSEPYRDAPERSGHLSIEPSELASALAEIDAAGFQAAVHAIGDRANCVVLDAFQKALGTAGNSSARHRIEHVQVISDRDIDRLATLGLIASVQPVHAIYDMEMADRQLGPGRVRHAYVWRKLFERGITVCAGSDFPVCSPDPFLGLHAAITRTTTDGRPPGGWYPDQAMTVEEAFRAFTINAARAAHQERELGSLEEGRHADLVFVDRDIFDPREHDRIFATRVLETWVGGRVVGSYS